jgi:hypothetical protein
MAKTNAEIQQEYNDALKVSQSMLGGLNKMIDETAKSQKKLSDGQKKYNENLKSIYSSAQDVESTEEAIIKAQKEKAGLSKRYFGANAKLLPQKQAEADVGIKSLKTELERLKVVNKVDDAQQRLTSSINGSLDGLLSGVSEIPGIGKALSGIAKGPVGYLQNSVSNAGKTFTTTFSNATASGASGMKAFAQAGGASMSSMATALAGPQGIVAAIVAVLALGVIAFYRVEKAARAFRDETGLLNSQTEGLGDRINNVYKETASLGASMEDVSKAASGFSNEFGNIEQASDNVLKSMVVLNKNFGVSIQDTAKINKAFQNMGGLTQDVAQSQSEALVSLAAQEGVAPKQVMADIAESAEEANGFFRGNTMALGAAAIQAAKMGTSLKRSLEVSKGLLNYQDSVSNEMEASAILGTNLNFSQSRYLAATGDVAGAQAEMVKQLRNTVNLGSLNTFEAEALAKATGMSVSEMQNMARLQELNLGLKENEDVLLQKAIKAGLDISKMSRDELLAKTQELAKQEQMQGQLESMGNTMSALGGELLQKFLPIGNALVSIFEVIMPIVTGIFGTIGNSIDSLMKAFEPISTIFTDIFGGKETEGFKNTLEVIGNILGGVVSLGINALANGIKMVMNIVGGVYKIFKGLFTMDFDMVLDGLLSLGEGIMRYFAAIPMILFDTIKDIFPGIGTWLEGLWTSIKASILSMIDGMLPDWVMSMIGANPMVPVIGKGALPDSPLKETETIKADDSIKDGIVQNGRVISTDPADTFIAAKKPTELMETINQGNTGESKTGMNGGVPSAQLDMSSVIAELKSLKEAFVSNKDVYINGEKMSDSITKIQEKSNINRFGIENS